METAEELTRRRGSGEKTPQHRNTDRNTKKIQHLSGFEPPRVAQQIQYVALFN